MVSATQSSDEAALLRLFGVPLLAALDTLCADPTLPTVPTVPTLRIAMRVADPGAAVELFLRPTGVLLPCCMFVVTGLCLPFTAPADTETLLITDGTDSLVGVPPADKGWSGFLRNIEPGLTAVV